MIWIVCLVVALCGFTVFFGAPYVPSKKSDVRRAFEEVYPLGENDVLVDIGSGDGVVLRVAATYGAKAVGYELNPLLVFVSYVLSRRHRAVTTRLANFYRATLPEETTIVYTFGDSRDIVKMAQKVQDAATKLGRPLAFMSYGFAVPGRTPLKQNGTHFLYTIEPLQTPGA